MNYSGTMKKTTKPFLNLDERNLLVALKVVAVMYLITLSAIIGIVLYRQIAMGQNIHDFLDVAIVLIVNALFLISALLYYGVFASLRVKIKHIVFMYLAALVISVLLSIIINSTSGTDISIQDILNKAWIMASICGILALFLGVFAILGKKRLEKELADD